jgi:hypothetical protein
MSAERWLELRQKVRNIGRPLRCPLCQFHFAYRHYSRAARTCPHCKVPLGFSFYYRLVLAVVYLTAAGLTMYKGYESVGPGWLLIGWPFAILLGMSAQVAILRAFPPKLEPHAEGNIWLKLT